VKIKSLKAQGFGSFTGEIVFDPERLNLVVGPNEAGKTTLAAAISAALYGLQDDGRRTRGMFTPFKQYQPWLGGAFALEMTFETEKGRFTVNRHFGRGTVTVFEDGRGNVTEDFRHGSGEYMIGEELLGLSLEQFARSALLLQEGPVGLSGAEVRPDGKLAPLLESQASPVIGDLSAQSALAVLDGALQKYAIGEKRLTITNQLRSLEQRIETLRVTLANETTRVDRAALSLAELGGARAKESELALAEKRALLSGLRANQAEIEQEIIRDGEARKQIDALEAELVPLGGIEPLPQDAAERLRRAETERVSAETALAELAARRDSVVTTPRRDLESKLEGLKASAWAAPVHLEEIAALERDLARAREGVTDAGKRREEMEADLERAGLDLRRWEELGARFAALDMNEAALLTRAPASIQAWGSEKEKADSLAEQMGERLRKISRERTRLRWASLGVGILGAAAGAFSVWLAVTAHVSASFVGLGVTLAGIALAIFLGMRAASHRASEHMTVLRASTEANRRQNTLRDQAAERTLALEEIARRLGMASAGALLEEHSDYLRGERDGSRLRWVREDLVRLDGEWAQARRRAADWMRRSGLDAPVAPGADWDAEAALRSVRELVAQVIALRGQSERLAQADRELSEQESSIRERRDRALDRAREVARSLGTPDGEWEKALEQIETRRKAVERREALEAEISRWRGKLRTEAKRAERDIEAERLRVQIDQASAEMDAPVELSAEEMSRTHGEWETERRALAKQLDEVRTRRVTLEREVGHYESPEREEATRQLRIELSDLERERAKALRFQEAVTLARERLASVARETNSRWSDFVTHRMETLLPALGPQYGRFLVTDDLDFSLEVAGQRLEREKLEQVLSAGARDQLRLALRLALCEFLSRGSQKLPLVLDDPFSASDDERAEGALRFLADRMIGEHQIFVLTCHRSRLEEMKRRDPEWFADRVHWIDLGAPAPAPGAVPPPVAPAPVAAPASTPSVAPAIGDLFSGR
jgi:DNA repair exonuclease SbcCD ATPase subunit